jgi:hypothetical protein
MRIPYVKQSSERMRDNWRRERGRLTATSEREREREGEGEREREHTTIY